MQNITIAALRELPMKIKLRILNREIDAIVTHRVSYLRHM